MVDLLAAKRGPPEIPPRSGGTHVATACCGEEPTTGRRTLTDCPLNGRFSASSLGVGVHVGEPTSPISDWRLRAWDVAADPSETGSSDAEVAIRSPSGNIVGSNVARRNTLDGPKLAIQSSPGAVTA